ncbi:MAG TPA: DegV family protein [Actinomycetes bacterium]|jgi:DegV family protein with EDD domain|nr:DegV family protein [Actinomycetes bacterium]
MTDGGRVALVTDSTCYLPTDLAAELGVQVVPLQVVIDGSSYDEADPATAERFADALRRRRAVTTSRPGPAAFASAYRKAAERGATAVVSVHLSSQMSGTVESARLAAKEGDLPVEVVDSGSLGMGLGYAVVSAAQAAAGGADTAEVAGAAVRRAHATSAIFYLDTLEHLRRGGRIGPAAALVGSALAMKPLLNLVDGHIEPLEKVRTSTRAIARLEDLAVEAAARSGSGGVEVAVHHLASPERAESLAGRLRERIPGLEDVYVGEVGAVVGAHVGPGMLAVVVAPR